MKTEIYVEDEFKRQFRKLAKRYRSLKADFQEFVDDLSAHPFQGADLGKGVRKTRMAIASKGKGKSGGARVITYCVQQESETVKIDLLTIYDKSDFPNISDHFIKFLLDLRSHLQ